MAITTLSAVQDIFAKLSPVVVAVRKIEGLEVDYTKLSGTGVGDMKTEFDDAITLLQPTSRIQDDQARQVLTRAFDSHTQQVRGWKQMMVGLERLALAAKLVTPENMSTDYMPDLVDRLTEVMERSAINAKVEANAVVVPTPTAASGNVGNAVGVTSKYATNVQGADASSQVNGKIKQNTYRIECIDNSTEQAEVWSVKGNVPRGGVTSPYWENVGDAGTIRSVSPVGNTLLNNGGFETMSPSTSEFANWVRTSGTWSAQVGVGLSTNKFAGTQALKLLVTSAADPTVEQTLSEGTLKPNTKYLLTCRAKKSTVSAVGSLKVGFVTTSGLYDQINTSAMSTSAFTLFTHVFNTGDDPSDLVSVKAMTEYASGATTNVYVDEVTLSPMPIIGDAGIAIVPGSTPAAVGDYLTTAVTNDHAGEYATHFARWHDTLLPASATPNVLDPA